MSRLGATRTLVEASRQAIQSGSVAVFNTKTFTNAAIAVDKFAGRAPRVIQMAPPSTA